MFKFDNIGGKIKTLARVIFIIEVVLIIIAGIVGAAAMLIEAIDYEEFGLLFATFLIPIPVFVSILFSWISVWPLYAFGDLVESNREIADAKKQ